jgi:hypothetical protein
MRHWEHPLLCSPETFDDIWQIEGQSSLLLIVGSGFDPRATAVLDRLVRVSERTVDGLLITLPAGSTDANVRPLADQNRAEIERLITSTGGALGIQGLPDYSDPRSLGRLISRRFQESRILEQYTDVVLDVSAMPRSVFFPLVRGVLERAHMNPEYAAHWPGNFHIAVCENPAIDSSVLEEGTTAMAPIGGFGTNSATRPDTTIWVPVLGEHAPVRVQRLHEDLGPDETCPVIPWPSRDPRRGDQLLVEYERLLFEEIRIERGNIIYADERNPFDLYRTLNALHARYLEALSPLGSVGMVLSSHSSKLLSLGVLLTAYENDLVVQHVSPGSYGLRGEADALRESDDLYDLWLTGIPYR